MSHVEGLSEDESYGSVEDEYVSWSCCREMGGIIHIRVEWIWFAFDCQYSCLGGVHVRDREIVIVALVTDRVGR